VIWVPQGCRCVYIQSSAIRRWLDRVRFADGYGDPFDEHYVLAFMLLHEMGHIAYGDGGRYLDDDASGANMNDSKAKRAESTADALPRRLCSSCFISKYAACRKKSQDYFDRLN